MTAKALLNLGKAALDGQQDATARQWLAQADMAAKRNNDPRLEAEVALNVGLAQDTDVTKAQAQLAKVRKLVKAHGWPDIRAQTYGLERMLAHKRHDVAAEEAADRAQLRLNESLGNDRGALGDVIALSRVLLEQHRINDAAALLQYAYAKACALHDAFRCAAAADYLASTLMSVGLFDRAKTVNAHLLAIAKQQHKPGWQGLALVVKGSIALLGGDSAAALKTYRAAYALIDPKQTPIHAIETLPFVAVAAYDADPDSLVALARQMDALVAAQRDPKPYRVSQQLVHALAAAAAGDSAASLAALRKAADGKSGTALDGNVRMVSFMLGHHNQAAAAVALRDFDPAKWPEATDLRNYALWAASQGDKRDEQVADARIASLREAAVRRLAAGPFATGPGVSLAVASSTAH